MKTWPDNTHRCASLDLVEMSLLSRIIGRLSAHHGNLQQYLESMPALLKELIHFVDGVLLHEYETPSGVHRLKFQFSSRGTSPCWDTIKSDDTLRLGDEIRQFEKILVREQAFAWPGATSGRASAQAAANTLLPWPNESDGFGGCIEASASGGNWGTTALLLRCNGCAKCDDSILLKNIALVNLILAPLHGSLLRHAAVIADSVVMANLTPKEVTIMQWVVEGKTSWEVGKILSISERTVKFHLANIYSKLNVVNRVQAVSLVNRVNNDASNDVYDNPNVVRMPGLRIGRAGRTGRRHASGMNRSVAVTNAAANAPAQCVNQQKAK